MRDIAFPPSRLEPRPSNVPSNFAATGDGNHLSPLEDSCSALVWSGNKTSCDSREDTGHSRSNRHTDRQTHIPRSRRKCTGHSQMCTIHTATTKQMLSFGTRAPDESACPSKSARTMGNMRKFAHLLQRGTIIVLEINAIISGEGRRDTRKGESRTTSSAYSWHLFNLRSFSCFLVDSPD